MTVSLQNTRATEFVATPSDVPGVLWLNASYRAESPHGRVVGPHFPVVASEWEEFEGWSVEQAYLNLPLTSPHAVAPAATHPATAEIPRAPQPAPTPAIPSPAAIPAPHASWQDESRRQLIGRQWQSTTTRAPNIVGESRRRSTVTWPTISDRLLFEARTQLSELTAALWGSTTGSRRVLITAKQPDEGATTTAMAVARWLAQSGRRVLLVDADSVTAALSRTLGLVGNWNREQSLASQCASLAHPRAISTDSALGTLDVLPTTCRPSAVGDSAARDEALAKTIQEQAPKYEAILIDAGPLMPSADSTWPTRMERFARLAETALVVRRPQRPAILSVPPIEPQLVAWGLPRIVIANITAVDF